MSYVLADAAPLAGLLGDAEIAALFSAEADLAAMLQVEAELARAEAACGVIPAEAGEAVAAACRSFRPDLGSLAAAAERDGVIVPELVRQLRAHVGPPHAAHVHHGATSQDVTDTSLALRLRAAFDLLDGRLGAIVAAIEGLERTQGANRLMGVTRMQAALPIRAGDRLAVWRAALEDRRARLAELRPRAVAVEFGGPVGTLETLGDRGPEVRRRLAAALGLADPGRCRHADRAWVAEAGGWFAVSAGSLGKIGADLGLMAFEGEGAVRLAGGGGSSAMPHKRNPIRAEVLVALARQAAALASGLDQAVVAEGERSGAALTLEWLTLPPLAVCAGAATRTALSLLGDVESLGRAP